MKKMIALNDAQRILVENNLPLVRWAIHNHITVNENIYGFSYDDLFQEGCIWLCKAAATFDAAKAVKFETYAQIVVRNGLRTYCRLMCNKQKRQMPVPEPSDEEAPFGLCQLSDDDQFEDMISELDTLSLLESVKSQYRGTVRLGIEAIELKAKGLNGAEIAEMYGVKPTHVGAWIHRASQKLKQNEAFLDSLTYNPLKKHLVKS
jgi:RNA polymerase sigma factor (sigma-70 family)